MNADPAELAKFSELAHRWWDLESEFRPLHEINPLAARLDRRHCADRGQQVLDVGCGGGILADSMARKGADVLGIDLADKALKVAQLHALEAGTPSVKYREVSAEALAARAAGQLRRRDLHGDARTCARPASVVQACATLVKPGGWVFFSTINRNAKAFLLRHRRRRIRAAACCRAARTNTRSSSGRANWRATAAPPVWICVHTRGMEYNPLTRRYWLSDDTSVNYMFATRKAALPA